MSKLRNDGDKKTLSVLGNLVPEREALHRDVLSSVSSQFWSQPIRSTLHGDGTVQCAPGNPTPLPLCAHSGLSRPQFLVASQAATIPCFPSYCSQDGGLVLDRVLYSTGGEGWWGTVSGRAKVQQIQSRSKAQGWKKTLSDPSNYSLCSNSLIPLPQGTTLRTKVTYQHPGKQHAATPLLRSTPTSQPGIPEGSAVTTDQQPDDGSNGWQHLGWLQPWLQPQSVSAAAQLRRRLRHAEIRADLAYNQDVLDSSAPSVSKVPFTASVDVSTPPNHLHSLQYRVGVHHATAPQFSTGSSGSSGTQQQQWPGEKLRMQTHMQGAIALQGQSTLWCGSPATRRASNRQRRQRSGKATHASTSRSSATTAAVRNNLLGPHNPIRQMLQRVLKAAPGSRGQEDEDEEVSIAGGSTRADGARSNGAAAAVGRHKDQGNNNNGSGREQLAWPQSLLPSPEEVQEGLQDATQSINRLRDDVQSLADWVSSGTFTKQLENKLGLPAGASSKRKDVLPAATHHHHSKPKVLTKLQGGSSSLGGRGQWSILVGPPHVRVAGLVGISARHPLWQPAGATIKPMPSVSSISMSGASSSGPAPPPSDLGSGAAAAGPQPRARAMRTNSLSSDLVRTGVDWLAQTFQDPQQNFCARPFASVGASAQVGWFQRAFLDYTRVSARLDLGLPGIEPAVQAAGGMSSGASVPVPHPAFALSQRGAWHAMTLSLSQQVLGPVRVCADLRYALKSSAPYDFSTTQLGGGGSGRSSRNPWQQPRGTSHASTSAEDSQQKNQAARLAHVVAAGVRGAAAQALGVAEQAKGAAVKARSLKPMLMDAAYGLDVAVPGISGWARLVAWYAPRRGEGMLELRLL